MDPETVLDASIAAVVVALSIRIGLRRAVDGTVLVVAGRSASDVSRWAVAWAALEGGRRARIVHRKGSSERTAKGLDHIFVLDFGRDRSGDCGSVRSRSGRGRGGRGIHDGGAKGRRKRTVEDPSGGLEDVFDRIRIVRMVVRKLELETRRSSGPRFAGEGTNELGALL